MNRASVLAKFNRLNAIVETTDVAIAECVARGDLDAAATLRWGVMKERQDRNLAGLVLDILNQEQFTAALIPL